MQSRCWLIARGGIPLPPTDAATAHRTATHRTKMITGMKQNKHLKTCSQNEYTLCFLVIIHSRMSKVIKSYRCILKHLNIDTSLNLSKIKKLKLNSQRSKLNGNRQKNI